MNLHRQITDYTALPSHASPPVQQSFQGSVFVETTRRCLPPRLMWHCVIGSMTSLHGVPQSVAVCFVSSQECRASCVQRSPQRPGSGSLGHRDADLSEEESLNSVRTGGEAASAHDRLLPQLPEQSKAWWAGRASWYARLPNWLSLRLSFIQIRRSSGFSDHLRFLSCVHWLAGWLTWYLNWKHKGIPLKWRALVRLMDILESRLGRRSFPHL